MTTTTVLDFGETQTLEFDWSEFLDTGETISAFSVISTGVTIANLVQSGESVTFDVSGGTPETLATIHAEITTSFGRTGVDQMSVYVSDVANQVPFGEIPVRSPGGVWPLDTGVCPDWEAMAPVTGRAATSAVNLLWRLTGRRYGLETITIRPCRTDDLSSARSSWSNGLTRPSGALPGHVLGPVVVDGHPVWGQAAACSTCLTPSRTSLTLPYPVAQLLDVTIEGTSIPLSQFVILDGNRIVWQSPTNALFPTSQDLTAPLGDPDTWSITLSYGRPLPDDAAVAAGILACEIGKALSDRPCALPRNVVTVVRQGITMQLADPEMMRRGLVGITEVDTFIRSVNPHGLTQAPMIVSPETVASHAPVTTWQGS